MAKEIILLVDDDEEMWKCGLEILKGRKESLSFFQTLLNKRLLSPQNTLFYEQILLEYSFCCVKNNMLDEAYRTLSDALLTSRCGTSWIHLGYCGIYAYWLFKKDSKKFSHLLPKAKSFLNSSIELNQSSDLFLKTLIDILIEERSGKEEPDFKSAADLVLFCLHKHPNRISFLR